MLLLSDHNLRFDRENYFEIITFYALPVLIVMPNLS